MQFCSNEIFIETLDSTFIEVIFMIEKASDQKTQHTQEISDNFMLLDSQFIKQTWYHVLLDYSEKFCIKLYKYLKQCKIMFEINA